MRYLKLKLMETDYNLGNTVQNASSNNLNATMNMDMLYKYLGLTKTQIKLHKTKKQCAKTR
jgi:hypothetical protein